MVSLASGLETLDHPSISLFILGLCENFRKVGFHVSSIPDIRVIEREYGKELTPIPGHSVVLVDLKGDEPCTFVIDLTGAQFGIRKPIWTYKEWVALWTQIPSFREVHPWNEILGRYRVEFAISSRVGRWPFGLEPAKMVLCSADAIVEEVAKWEESEGLKLKEFLGMQEKEYLEVSSDLIGRIGKVLAPLSSHWK